MANGDLRKCPTCRKLFFEWVFWLENLKRPGKICTTCREVQQRYWHRNRKTLNERKRERYQENREAVLVSQRHYRQINREVLAERNRERYQENRDTVRNRIRKYVEENRNVVRERQRKHYQENREKICEANRAYYRENREAQRKLSSERHRVTRDLLTNGYVKTTLNLPPGTPVPQELIELQRAKLQLHRAIKEQTK